MTPVEIVVLLVIAAICGTIGQKLVGSSKGGLVMAIVLGFIGALVGRFLASSLGLPEVLDVQIGDKTFPLVWSIIGSALFVVVVSFLTRGKA